jgi:hypothetical protein
VPVDTSLSNTSIQVDTSLSNTLCQQTLLSLIALLSQIPSGVKNLVFQSHWEFFSEFRSSGSIVMCPSWDWLCFWTYLLHVLNLPKPSSWPLNDRQVPFHGFTEFSKCTSKVMPYLGYYLVTSPMCSASARSAFFFDVTCPVCFVIKDSWTKFALIKGKQGWVLLLFQILSNVR